MTYQRVLVYAPALLPRSQIFVLDQARGLRRWEPVLVGRERVTDGLHVDDLAAVEMRSVPTARVAITRLAQRATRRVPLIRQVAARIRPSLIHAHFLTGGFDVAASLRPLPCPLVITAHGFDATWYGAPPHTLRLNQWLHGLLRHRLLRANVHFIAVSRFIATELVRLGADPDRVTVHHTGVDTSLFVPPEHAQSRRGVLFVGRLVEKKGAMDMLAAIARLRSQGLRVPVEIIGDGPQRRNVERYVARHELDVVVRGAQPRHVVLEAMQHAAVLCNPSRTGRTGDREGFGMVLAEAQSTALPVIATTCGGMRDAVDDGRTGILVPERDIDALTDALGKCLTDDVFRHRLGGAARSWVVENFDLRTQNALLEELYDQLAQRR